MNDLVRNAADPKQVKHAARKEKDRANRDKNDLLAVLATVEGRRYIWNLMAWTGMLENPTHQRGDMTHQNIGRADCGRKILADIMDASPNIYLTMQQEAWRQKSSDAVEAEAVRTPSAMSATDSKGD